jgi:hypothetical protein
MLSVVKFVTVAGCATPKLSGFAVPMSSQYCSNSRWRWRSFCPIPPWENRYIRRTRVAHCRDSEAPKRRWLTNVFAVTYRNSQHYAAYSDYPFRYGSKLLSKFNYLANGLASGDFKPTGQQAEVQKVLEDRLRDASSQWESLAGKELGGFNDLLRKKNVPNIIAKTP